MSDGDLLAGAFANAFAFVFVVGMVVGAVGIGVVLWLWRHVDLSIAFR